MGLIEDLLGPSPTGLGENIIDLFRSDEAMQARYAAGIDEVAKMIQDARAELAQRSGLRRVTDEVGSSGTATKPDFVYDPATGGLK